MSIAQKMWNWFEPAPPVRKSLAEKLSEVSQAVGGIGQKGWNELDGFAYTRWFDVASAVRGEMAKRHIVLIPQEIEIIEEKSVMVPTKDGSNMPGVQIKIRRGYNLTDGFETIHGWSVGVGEDHRDKAMYKADTGAEKYFLRDLFIIPNREDDPELVADKAQAELAEVDQPLSELRPDLAAKIEEQGKEITAHTIRAWNELCKKHGKTVKQRRAWLMVNCGVKTIVEVKTKAEQDKAIRWASSREDLADTLTASVAAAQPIIEVMDAPQENDAA